MSVGAISAGSLAQDVLTSSNITQAQQAWQKVQTSLAAGDLTGAKSAFATFQQINQNLSALSATTTGTQLSTDLSTLGSALTAGNLSSAQTAFATVQNDLKNSQSPALTNALQAESQAVQLVDGFLSSLGPSSSSRVSDATNAALQSAYGTGSALNVYA
jgi:hypothetical protein